ncbi:MAG: protein translocase subunit SecF [Treponema sp.]|nr:protein translocase subunit SecF [Treponema sp.]
MKKILRFSKLFFPAMIFSSVLIIAGIVSYFFFGFNMGVDFQSGYIYEVQIAPTAFNVNWHGRGNAAMEISSGNIYISTGSGAELQSYTFLFNDYENLDKLTEEMQLQIDGLEVTPSEGIDLEKIPVSSLVRSAQGDSMLSREYPYPVHYLDAQSAEITVPDVRNAFSNLEQNVVVQNMGSDRERRFMIRIEAEKEESIGTEEDIEIESNDFENESEDEDNAEIIESEEWAAGDNAEENGNINENEEGPEMLAEEFNVEFNDETDDSIIDGISEDLSGMPIDSEIALETEETNMDSETALETEETGLNIIPILEEAFGKGNVVILRSDFVHPRFSENLSSQAFMLMAYTILIILLYASLRFKPQYAVGAVIALLHDTIVIVAFIIWSGMEFNTTTIAAILTILGYSINNTIVIFDRVRENRRIYPDEDFLNLVNRSLTDTLTRTVITTLTTMLAVMALLIFTTGSMRDFALALQVGMISGIYTSIFIANGVVSIFESQKVKREKKKFGSAVPAGKTQVKQVPAKK